MNPSPSYFAMRSRTTICPKSLDINLLKRKELTLTFQDLQEAVKRLEADPRVHPNTQVEVHMDTRTGPEQELLASIAMDRAAIVLSSTDMEHAIAR